MKFRGAEAIVETIEWNGQTVISKMRNKRGYRHPALEKRLVVEMPMTLAKAQSMLLSLLPIPPILTKDQCVILSEKDNIVSGDHLTIKDLNIKPTDVEKEMEKWLWRYRSGGEFAKV